MQPNFLGPRGVRVWP